MIREEQSAMSPGPLRSTSELPISHAPSTARVDQRVRKKRGARDGRGDVPCLHATAQKKEEMPIAGVFWGLEFWGFRALGSPVFEKRDVQIVVYCA